MYTTLEARVIHIWFSSDRKGYLVMLQEFVKISSRLMLMVFSIRSDTTWEFGCDFDFSFINTLLCLFNDISSSPKDTTNLQIH